MKSKAWLLNELKNEVLDMVIEGQTTLSIARHIRSKVMADLKSAGEFVRSVIEEAGGLDEVKNSTNVLPEIVDLNKYYYKIYLTGGNTTVVKARNIDEARKYALAEFGRNLQPSVCKATEGDIAWVKGMGGCIHEA